MSSLGISLLNEVTVNGETDPAEILNNLTHRIQSNFHLSEDHFDAVIGMDISLSCINKQKMEMHYAGASNPLLIVRNNEMIELTANAKSISLFDREQKFVTTKVSIEKGDMVYHRTDGIIDQFGKNNESLSDGSGIEFSKIEKQVAAIINYQASKEDRIKKWRTEVKQGNIGKNAFEIPLYKPEVWMKQSADMNSTENSNVALRSYLYRFYQAASIHRQFVLRELLPDRKLIVA